VKLISSVNPLLRQATGIGRYTSPRVMIAQTMRAVLLASIANDLSHNHARRDGLPQRVPGAYAGSQNGGLSMRWKQLKHAVDR
jgi:hypothetical protein